MAKKTKRKILLDANIIFSFVRGEIGLFLPKIFPNHELVLLSEVDKEIKDSESKSFIQLLVKSKSISIIDNTSSLDYIQEYSILNQQFGSGESACMAFCKFSDDVIASSDFKGIVKYCDENAIEYLGMMDFLVHAWETGVMTETQCNACINGAKKKNDTFTIFSNIAEYVTHGNVRRISE